MPSTTNRSAKTIWAIEHSSDYIWLLELLLGKIVKKVVQRIKD